MKEKTLRLNLSKKLKEVYDFNDYDISNEKIVKIIIRMREINPKKTEEEIMKFLDMVDKGVYGMLYRAPICILSMYQKYCEETTVYIPKINLAPENPR